MDPMFTLQVQIRVFSYPDWLGEVWTAEKEKRWFLLIESKITFGSCCYKSDSADSSQPSCTYCSNWIFKCHSATTLNPESWICSRTATTQTTVSWRSRWNKLSAPWLDSLFGSGDDGLFSCRWHHSSLCRGWPVMRNKNLMWSLVSNIVVRTLIYLQCEHIQSCFTGNISIFHPENIWWRLTVNGFAWGICEYLQTQDTQWRYRWICSFRAFLYICNIKRTVRLFFMYFVVFFVVVSCYMKSKTFFTV